MIVDRAERLGLGQLHQLRGRVGRSGQRAYAYLFHPADQVLSETAYERLRTIGDNTALGSGFKIAMRDLEIRGAGNLLGHDQSGPVAAVGYDLYVQLVAEAVADAKGFVVPEVVQINLDVPGEAHLPKNYVEADDARLEAYRRLVGVTTHDELARPARRVARPLRTRCPRPRIGSARTGRDCASSASSTACARSSCCPRASASAPSRSSRSAP